MADKKNAQAEFAERITAELIERLKNGTAPFQKMWEPGMKLDVPYNHISGHTYSGTNRVWLMMQPYADPRWMTYRQAQSVGAQVRKGEQGTSLVKLVTHVEKNAKDENGKTIKDEAGKPVKVWEVLDKPYLRSFVVFNAEQIDGLPAYEARQAFVDHERAERLLKASGAKIQHHNGNRAFYAPAADKIVLPMKEQFVDTGSYYAVALHELGHWTGHESRLNRPLMNEYGSEAYAQEELRAEISSMMLTRELGLPHNPDQHAHYVGSWISCLENDPMEILRASRDAAKIKDYIMAFEQQIEQEKTPEKAPEPAAIEQDKPAISGQENRQTAEERLQTAKERYLMQTALMPPAQQQTRRLLEHSMEKVVAGLPPDMQTLARTNFYESQLKQSPAQDMTPPLQGDLSFER